MRKVVFILLFGAIFGLMGLVLTQHKLAAFTCNMSGGACGYFTDVRVNATDNVLPNPALQGVNGQTTSAAKAKALTDAIHWFLITSPSYRNHVGAAFIVDAMLGYRLPAGQSLKGPVGGGQGAGISYAQAHYGEWASLVNDYANPKNTSYGINWSHWPAKSAFCGGRLDSGYDPGKNDVALYYTPAFGTFNCDYEYSHSMPEIQFFWPGGTFDIGTLCGNVQDSAGPIPGPDQMPTATITVNCNASLQQVATVKFDDLDGATTGYITINGYTSPSVSSGSSHDITIPSSFTDPTNVQNVYLHVKDVGPLAPPNTYAIFRASTDVPCVSYGCSIIETPVPIDPFMNYQIAVKVKTVGSAVPAGTTVGIKVTAPSGLSRSFGPLTVGGNGNATETATFSNLPATGSTGQFKVDSTVTATSGTTACSTTFNVVNLPYLNVYGGDVMTGASPAAGNACDTNTFGGVFSWNRFGAGYAGAGSEYAVQALDQIDEFGSAMNPSSSARPSGLSFANSGAAAAKPNPGQGLYGGFFADLSGGWACGDDFTTGMGAPTNANTTIGSAGGYIVNNSVQDLHYVLNHDVYITSDIKYASGPWASPADIPLFKLVVVGGNIYIDSSVKQLDGIYVAEPSGGNKGQIITCATNAGGIWKSVNPAANNFYSTCNNKLTINGAFVARQVLFGRTSGTVGQATPGDTLGSNHDAEVFNYTPEIWLPRNASAPADTYDAITALPPVL